MSSSIPLLAKKHVSSSRSCTIIGYTGFLFLIIIIAAAYHSTFSSPNHHHTHNNVRKYEKRKRPDIVIPSIWEKVIADSSSYYKSDGADDKIDVMLNLELGPDSSCSQSPTECGFNQYSGYLMTLTGHEIHYWFFEADTEDDPLEKPLFFWTNGGPGCSGMMGLFTEQGPWRVVNTTKDVFTDLEVIYNPDSWITEVNMVFLEQPYGVGFSSVDDQDEPPVAGDVAAAEDMAAVIRNFLVKFPEHADSDVYLSGESFGGHYIPMTTWEVLENNEDGLQPYVNFKGFFLGNPYTNYYENFYGFMDSLYGHGLMKNDDYDIYRKSCWNNATAVDDSMTCDLVYVGAYYSAYEADFYALDWPVCSSGSYWSAQQAAPVRFKALKSMKRILEHPDFESLALEPTKDELLEMYMDLQKGSVPRRRLKAESSKNSKMSPHYSFQTKSYVPCSDDYGREYLNLYAVQNAINVKPGEFAYCNDLVYDLWPTDDWYRYMERYYTKIFDKYSMEYDIRMAVYSGDDDSVCAQSGTQYWMNMWPNFETADSADWVPWKDEGSELAGYYTIWANVDYPDYNALHFLTVRSAGHMVPSTQPGRSVLLLKKYLYELTDWGGASGKDGLMKQKRE